VIRFGPVLAVVMVVLGGVAADAATTARTPPPPVPGAWKVHPLGSGIRSGHFVVTHHKTVRGLTLTFSANEMPGCSGTVTVVGQQRIYNATGTNLAHIHYSDWAVGENHPRSGTVIQPEKVTLERDGQRFAGGLSLAWLSPRGGPQPKSEGTIKFRAPGQPSCGLNFTFKKQ
jgi:hypothetical protein